MIPTRTLRMLYLAFDSMDATGGDGNHADGRFHTFTPRFKITSTGQRDKSGERNANYLDVKWALEQIGAYAIAVRSGLPMRQVPRVREKGEYRD